MKKFLKIFLGVLFAALLLGTFVFLWQKTRPVKVVYTIVQPKLDTLKQFVVATGKVEPRDEVLIKPQISGIVSDVYKEAGQMVRKGEVIATVKVVPEMGQLSSAESRVSVAEISLAQTAANSAARKHCTTRASSRTRSSNRGAPTSRKPRRNCRTPRRTWRSSKTASPAATRSSATRRSDRRSTV